LQTEFLERVAALKVRVEKLQVDGFDRPRLHDELHRRLQGMKLRVDSIQAHALPDLMLGALQPASQPGVPGRGSIGVKPQGDEAHFSPPETSSRWTSLRASLLAVIMLTSIFCIFILPGKAVRSRPDRHPSVTGAPSTTTVASAQSAIISDADQARRKADAHADAALVAAAAKAQAEEATVEADLAQAEVDAMSGKVQESERLRSQAEALQKRLHTELQRARHKIQAQLRDREEEIRRQERDRSKAPGVPSPSALGTASTETVASASTLLAAWPRHHGSGRQGSTGSRDHGAAEGSGGSRRRACSGGGEGPSVEESTGGRRTGRSRRGFRGSVAAGKGVKVLAEHACGQHGNQSGRSKRVDRMGSFAEKNDGRADSGIPDTGSPYPAMKGRPTDGHVQQHQVNRNEMPRMGSSALHLMSLHYTFPHPHSALASRVGGFAVLAAVGLLIACVMLCGCVCGSIARRRIVAHPPPSLVAMVREPLLGGLIFCASPATPLKC